jgi:hypothetical protein
LNVKGKDFVEERGVPYLKSSGPPLNIPLKSKGKKLFLEHLLLLYLLVGMAIPK